MNKLLTLLLLMVVTLLSAANRESTVSACNDQIYFTSPAKIWEETLPLGNGRLGMMPDGGINHERIVLNEISMWSGSECDYSNPDAAKSLPEIRKLLFAGKNYEAQQLMYRSFVPKKQVDDKRYGTYQLLAMLELDFSYPKGFVSQTEDVSEYRRTLDFRRGIATTRFVKDGVEYERECFVSRSRDVMCVHLKASKTGALNFRARLSRPERGEVTVETDDGQERLVLGGMLDSGQPGKDGMKYVVKMKLINKQGGERTLSVEQGIGLDGGEEAWLILSATTSYEATGTYFPGGRYEEVCDKLLNGGTEGIEKTHTAAHRALYDRVRLEFPFHANDSLPINERILCFRQEPTSGMAALYYNYGRYLLISSTRPGSLPPNLQGLWANGISTPWNGDYHTNINVQMNHWPLEQAGLGELYDPLTTLVERAVPDGEQSAKAFYGDKAEGWVMHMMTNVWNYTAPGEHPSWGATNTGGAWLCAHLWEHYLYSQDKEYLRRIYPVMKGAAHFFHTTMVKEPAHGWLVTAPTSSPENSFYLPGDDKHQVSICMGPTMDVQLLTELYTNVISATRILGIDADYAARLEADLKQFPPMQISKEGYLQEWLEDYREAEIHHRHVAHLYGLHPANLISPDKTPALAEACRVTLNRRGDEATGWSRAWKMNFWARLGDGNRAWKLFRSLLQPAVDAQTGKHGSGTFPNLFCSHAPFQIDGNYGGAAGVGEMLLQSHQDFIDLLPALPDSWSEGRVRGMRVRGGAMIDMDWKQNQLTMMKIKALHSGEFKIKLPDDTFKSVKLKRGQSKVFRF